MKPHTLPVKRRPVPKGIFKRLSAVTGNRKQRVAATATPDMEIEDNSSKISRALTIIFLIHIVAIGLIFVHQKFLDGRTPDEPKAAMVVAQQENQAAAGTQQRMDLPRVNKGEKSIPVTAGDNYTRIAAREGVDEGDLRLLNRHADIVPGLILKIPPKRPVAEPAEAAAILESVATESSDGLVSAIDVSDAPRAKLVRPNIARGAEAAAAPVVASGKTYVVQNGDSVWRIANRFKVNQDALMKANGITDARKIKAGMSLAIPR
ncbi:MAG: LysM peptidoglycan-binding domain-containing protein [Verrucomicrobiota bacterium]